MRLVWAALVASTPWLAWADEAPSYETVVTTQAPTKSASERRVDSDVLDTTPTRSAQDLLRLVPGLWATQHGSEGKGYQWYLRGMDAAHGQDLEVRVNGVPVNELSNVHGQGYVDLGFVIPEVVRALRAQKGPFSAEQGPFGIAGTVDLTLGVSPGVGGLRLGYEAGIQNRHRLVAVYAPRDAAPSTFVAAEALYDAGFGQNRHTRRANVFGQIALWSSEVRALTLWISGFATRFGEPGLVPFDDVQRGVLGYYDAYTQDATSTSRRAMASLTYTDNALLPGRLSVTLFTQARDLFLDENFTGQLHFPATGDRKQQLERRYSAGLRGSYTHKLAGRTTLTVGTQAQADTLRQHEDQVSADGQPWRRNLWLEGIQAALAAHALVTSRPLRPLRVELGARVDGFLYDVRDPAAPKLEAQRAVGALSPRLSLTYEAHHALTLYGAFGRGVRAPEARAMLAENTRPPEDVSRAAYLGGSSTVTWANAAELGMRVTPWSVVELTLAGFWTAIAREVVFDHVANTTLELNATRRLGAELGVVVRPCSWLTALVDGTWVSARFVDSQAQVPGAPTFLTTATVSAHHPSGLSFGAQWLYLAARPLAHGATANAVSTLGLVTRYRYDPFELGLVAENATFQRWSEGEFHYASWFDATAPRSQLPRRHYAAGTPFNLRLTLTVHL